MHLKYVSSLMSSISICWLPLFWRLMKKKRGKKITKSYTVHSGMWLPQTWGKVRKERQPSFAWWCVPITMASLCGGLGSLFLKHLNIVRFELSFELPTKWAASSSKSICMPHLIQTFQIALLYVFPVCCLVSLRGAVRRKLPSQIRSLTGWRAATAVAVFCFAKSR